MTSGPSEHVEASTAETESHTYRYQVSLRLFHPSEPLGHVSETIGLIADHLHVIGEPRLTRRGEPLPGVYERSYWIHSLDLPDSEGIENCLLAIVQSLTRHAKFLRQLIDSGGSAGLFIGFFLEGPNTSIHLSPELMRECASLGLALDFDVYDYGGPSSEA